MIGYLDCSTGVSGDKFLGALLDIGTQSGAFTADHLRGIVGQLAPEATVDVERVVSRGVTATGVRVHAAHQPHSRTWGDIRTLIEAADLPGRVRETSLSAFRALAEAEAGVHGGTVDSVHFHEVGAIDSIVDMVGVCAGVHALGIERLIVSAVAVGSGTVETSHGTLAVPAPATATLLLGVPVLGGPATGELTTPTGAALLHAVADEFGPLPALSISKIGYGAGTRDIGVPNVCRLSLGTLATPSDAVDTVLEPVVVLETNIDHLSAEELAFCAEELMLAGALDVWQTPIVMKKGRSATMLSVLCAAADATALATRTIALTGSLGVRELPMQRHVTPREQFEVDTPWGPIAVKSGGGRIRPEHDAVARIAREHGIAYAVVVATVQDIARTRRP